MKQLILAFAFLVTISVSHAQSKIGLPIFQEIPAFRIGVSYTKTVNLVFPFDIKSVDRGCSDLLAQKAKGVENVLQVKAGRRDFAETNLSVITSDGRLFSFRVLYDEDPYPLNYSFAGSQNQGNRDVIISGRPLNEWDLNLDAAKARQAQQFMHKSAEKNGLKAVLKSSYVSNGIIWFSLDITNNTLLPFNLSLYRFTLKDNERSKRTTLQEEGLDPVFIDKDVIVKGMQTKTVVIGIKQFVVPKNQHLLFELSDASENRSLFLPIKHKVVLKTKLLP